LSDLQYTTLYWLVKYYLHKGVGVYVGVYYDVVGGAGYYYHVGAGHNMLMLHNATQGKGILLLHEQLPMKLYRCVLITCGLFT